MSQAADFSPPDDAQDDGVPEGPDLSALLSSRLCHDLINPVGALSSGLDVLDDPSMDASMREAAFDLIRSGAGKAIALLSYARLAYGAAGGYGAEIGLEDAQKALEDLYATTKAELVWNIGAGFAPKENVKVLMILAYAAADSVPRGGTVTINGDMNAFAITAAGKKVLLQDALVRALAGDAAELTPKFTPAYIASGLAGARGGTVSAEIVEDTAIFRASFGGGSDA